MANITWSTVARNGHKKARPLATSNVNNTPVDMGKRPACKQNSQLLERPQRMQAPNKESSAPSRVDKRVFLRLPHDHDWRKLSPAGIREVVVKNLAISPGTFGRVKPVRSGFALSPCNDAAREEILKAGNGLFLTGAKIEPATNWEPLIIPTVPSSIRTLGGLMEVTETMLSNEIERVTKVKPASLKLYGHNNSNAPHRTWMALFTKAPRVAFRVFDESGLGRPFKKSKPQEFCNRCNGHHSAKNCSRAPSCGNCGSTMHAENTCVAPTKCRNCGGPHRSDSRRCLARPTRSGAPTKEQLKTYRQAGEREFQALVRAKEAETRAVAAVGGNTSTEDVSLPTESSGAVPQTSPVEASTDDAMRL